MQRKGTLRNMIIYLGGPDGFEAVSDTLAARFSVRHVAADPAAVLAALPEAVAVVDASMKVRFDAEMFAAASHLRMISTATTGSDHIDRDAAAARGVTIRTLKEDVELLRSITPAAELSWALIMACARRLLPAVAHVRAGNWVREEFPGMMLNGRTLGLVGCGRIGQWMARYANAFGMRVVGHDPFLTDWPVDIEKADIAAVCSEADIVSVHVHLSEDTRGLISRDLFQKMKVGAIFVNTSRGAVADEAALVDALESGHLAAAGLDVLDGEPAIESHPLLAYAQTHDNLLITPHCGGYSPDAVRRVSAHAATKIARHFEPAQ